MTRGPIEWLANAPVDQLFWTCLVIAGLLGGGTAAAIKWRHDKRQP